MNITELVKEMSKEVRVKYARGRSGYTWGWAKLIKESKEYYFVCEYECRDHGVDSMARKIHVFSRKENPKKIGEINLPNYRGKQWVEYRANVEVQSENPLKVEVSVIKSEYTGFDAAFGNHIDNSTVWQEEFSF